MTKHLIDAYYDGIARKAGWDQPLSDAVRFVSPGGAVTNGKAAFIEANTRFLRAVKSAVPKQTLIDGSTACVWMAYELVSPRGRQTTLDVLEIWRRCRSARHADHLL
jgi:hypothetical protein